MTYRLNVRLTDEAGEKFESMKSSLGLSSPKLIEYLMAKKDLRPKSLVHSEIIYACSSLNNTLRAAISSEKVFSDEERIEIFEKIKEIENRLEKL